MAAGYGEATLAEDGTQCVLQDYDGSCLATRQQVFSNLSSAVAAGFTAGIVGTVVNLAIIIPLTPVLSKMGAPIL